MDLTNSILAGADLSDANLSYTDLRLSTLVHTRLCRANLGNASLPHMNFHGADLQNAILTGATAAHTSFDSVDLSMVKGLKSIIHRGPSTVGIDSIYLSRGNIPEVFLRGCGVPDEFITYARSLVGKVIEFYSCFISYSTKDEDFARRLYSRMRDEKLRVWFAPEDIKSGRRLMNN